MHNICQQKHEKCHELMEIYMPLLRIRLTLICFRLLSLAILLFNRPSRSTLLSFIRPPQGMIMFGSNHSALINSHPKQVKTFILRKKSFLSTGSTVAVHIEHREPWTHGTMMWHGTDGHKDIGYKV